MSSTSFKPKSRKFYFILIGILVFVLTIAGVAWSQKSESKATETKKSSSKAAAFSRKVEIKVAPIESAQKRFFLLSFYRSKRLKNLLNKEVSNNMAPHALKVTLESIKSPTDIEVVKPEIVAFLSFAAVFEIIGYAALEGSYFVDISNQIDKIESVVTGKYGSDPIPESVFVQSSTLGPIQITLNGITYTRLVAANSEGNGYIFGEKESYANFNSSNPVYALYEKE